MGRYIGIADDRMEFMTGVDDSENAFKLLKTMANSGISQFMKDHGKFKRSFLIFQKWFVLFSFLICFGLSSCRTVPVSELRGQPPSEALEEFPVLMKNNERIRIAVYSGEGAFEKSIEASIRMFAWMGADAQRITPAEIVAGKLAHFDILYMTGGWAVPYVRDLQGQGVENIRSFMENGGGYIGICAGAFFAADSIIWEGIKANGPLAIFPGVAEGPIAEIAPWPLYKMSRINIAADQHPIVEGEPPSLSVMYYGGPWFHLPPGTHIEILATYAANGKPAMVAYSFGKGRVFLSGIHPEFRERGNRNGVPWDNNLYDKESEWPLMYRVVKWIIQEE